MMESQGCSPDEIVFMLSRIKGDIQEFYESKEIQHILLITLDYDACAAILTMLFEANFPNKVSSIHQRLKMQDYYFDEGVVEKAMKLAMNLSNDIKRRVKEFKAKHPNGTVIGLNGSYRQDYDIDTGNRCSHNDQQIIGYDYHPYNDYFKGVIPSGKDGLICVEDGDMDYIFKWLGIDYIPQCYADGDGEVGCSLGKMDMTVYNNKPKKLKNALGKPIKQHDMSKRGLVEAHFAKIENRFPGADIKMVFYDDNKGYLGSIKKTPMKENWSVKTMQFVGWPDSEAPIPVEVFA